MEHQNFPVEGFEFIDEPATEVQKEMIVELCKAKDIPIDRHGVWPDPFSKWDAMRMIASLKEGD